MGATGSAHILTITRTQLLAGSSAYAAVLAAQGDLWLGEPRMVLLPLCLGGSAS